MVRHLSRGTTGYRIQPSAPYIAPGIVHSNNGVILPPGIIPPALIQSDTHINRKYSLFNLRRLHMYLSLKHCIDTVLKVAWNEVIKPDLL